MRAGLPLRWMAADHPERWHGLGCSSWHMHVAAQSAACRSSRCVPLRRPWAIGCPGAEGQPRVVRHPRWPTSHAAAWRQPGGHKGDAAHSMAQAAAGSLEGGVGTGGARVRGACSARRVLASHRTVADSGTARGQRRRLVWAPRTRIVCTSCSEDLEAGRQQACPGRAVARRCAAPKNQIERPVTALVERTSTAGLKTEAYQSRPMATPTSSEVN